ncbi:MAG: DUF3592 domain-containing protein [Acidobacteriota bacterium]
MTDDPIETRPAAGSRGAGCVTMAALFLVVGLGGLALVGIRAWRDVRVFTVWQPATCTVVEATIGSRRSSSGSRGSTSYRPEITYSYEFGGRPFRCIGWDAWAVWGDYGGGSLAYYQRVLDRFPVGGTFPCWVDPAEPSHAVLVRRIRPLYVLALLPIALTVLGALGLMAALSKPSGGPRQPAPEGEHPDDPRIARRLAVRLEADSDPASQSCGAAVITTALLFVAGIAGYAAWSAWQDGTVAWLPWVFVLVFGGLGLLFLWISVVSAFASRIPRVIVEIDRRSLAPGESAQILVRQPGPVRMRSIALALVGEELTARPKSSPDVRVLHDEVVARCGPATAGPTSPIELQTMLEVPEDAMPSSGADPQVRWRLRVAGVPSVWPRYTLTFPIMVERRPG